MLQFRIIRKKLLLFFLFCYLSLEDGVSKTSKTNNPTTSFEKILRPLLHDAEEAINNFSNNSPDLKVPLCYWDVSPSFGAELNALLRTLGSSSSGSGLDSKMSQNNNQINLSQNGKDKGSDGFSRLRKTIKSRNRLVRRKGLHYKAAYVVFRIARAYIENSNPASLTFLLTHRLVTKTESMTISLVCPGKANLIYQMQSKVPKKKWRRWKFVYDKPKNTLKFSTPTNVPYNIISPISVINTLLSTDANFKSSDWFAEPVKVAQNGEPRNNIVAMRSYKSRLSSSLTYFMVDCPLCAESQFVFYTVSSARNILPEQFVWLKSQPRSFSSGTVNKPNLNAPSTFLHDATTSIRFWLAHKTEIHITSSLDGINFDAENFDKTSSPHIIYIQFLTNSTGLFYVKDSSTTLHLIGFTFNENVPAAFASHSMGFPVHLEFNRGVAKKEESPFVLIAHSYKIPYIQLDRKKTSYLSWYINTEVSPYIKTKLKSLSRHVQNLCV